MAKRWVPINLTGGLNTDANLDNVEVADVQNMVSDPDGGGMRLRDGSAVYQRATNVTTPVGGIAMTVNSRLPNLDNSSWLVSCSNTSSNNRIEHLALTRPRNNISADSLDCNFHFQQASYFVIFGQQVIVTVVREGNIGRSVTVNYATANGTASAGTDYTAASGTLTFAPGDVTKTITLTTADANQTTDKNFTISLSSASAGAQLTEPKKATIFGQTLFLLVGQGDWNTANLVWPIYMYNPIAGRVTAHYIKRNGGVAGSRRHGSGAPIVRVNRDTIAACIAGGSLINQLSITLYSVPQILAEGAAYSAGAANIGAAIKHSPYATITVSGTLLSSDGDYFWIVPYTNSEFFVVGLTRMWKVNIGTGTIAAEYPSLTGSSSFTAWTNIAGYQGNNNAGCRPQFGPNGMLYVYVDTMNATNVRKVLMFDPETGALEATSAAISAQGSGLAILSDGSVLVGVGSTGTTISKFSADLATKTDLSNAVGAPRTGFYSGGTSWYSHNNDSSPFDFYKRSVSGSTVATDVTYQTGPPFTYVSGENLGFQMGLMTATTFAAGFNNDNGTNVCGVYNVADGTVAAGFAQINQQDFYNAESVSGSLFTTGGFNGNITRNDQPDITLYHLKNFVELIS